jgi:hypothetical protein
MNNNKGITIFEMLVTISVASIVIMMLMGILTTTLLTKNQVDYTNRLDDDIFDMMDYISGQVETMGYKSILQYDNDLVLDEGQYAFLISTEFRPAFEDVGGNTTITFVRDVFTVKILLLDTERNTIYFDTLYSVDPLLDIDTQIDTFIAQQDSLVTMFLTNPTGAISSPNLIIHEGSEIVYKSSDPNEFCVKFYDSTKLSNAFGIDSLVSNCGNAYININLVVSFELNSGGELPQKNYNSTLFF